MEKTEQQLRLEAARAKCEAQLRENWKRRGVDQKKPEIGAFVLFFKATDEQARRIAQDVQASTGIRPTLNRDRAGGV